ncbi:MAG TPA: aminotransferase class I/II-fold pyridoxal phosphate-dependent enzyme, partial [Phycisphaerae bacterium]|nr:aminotransferase class I/II-fold pyridoxal phosphate-dependent enzyme [Phycisphaerae bacterium]
MKVPLLDLKAQFRTIEKDIRAAIDRVLESQHFIMGPEVTGLESEVAAFTQCSHAVGVSSGTDAILCALMACGVGPGDEVIVPTFTFFATAGCVSRLGARPVFADIEPDTYNIDPAKLGSLITPKTKAIIPVHLFGQCAEMDPIMDLVKGRNI